MNQFYLSRNNQVQLRCLAWYPTTAPVGIVQIIHGVTEHMERYAEFAQFLNDHGFIVVGEDHPGHGGSVREGDRPGYLYGGWMEAVAGVRLLHDEMKKQYPHLPYYMLGHSMGSFLLRTFLFTYPDLLDGAIISGTGWQPAGILPMGLLMCRAEAARLGERSSSPLLESMMFGGYNKAFAPNRTTHDWLTTDDAVVDAYVSDPLCGFPVSIQLCREMMTGLRMIQNPTNLSRMRKNLPVLFIAGEKDPVGSMGKGVKKTMDAFRQAGMMQVCHHLYPEMRHEVLNERNKQQVFADVLAWLMK